MSFVVVVGAGKRKKFWSKRSKIIRIMMRAGVVGLSTALKIQEKGHSVTVVAEAFSDDAKSTRYTSIWAVSNEQAPSG